MKYSKEIKIGAVIVLTIAFSFWGFNFLKGFNIFGTQRHFYAVYPKVEGLTISSPVLINGYKIGFVQTMYFHPDNSGNVIVKMQLTNTSFNVPVQSTARIISADLLGSKAIELVMKDTLVYAESGDTLLPDIKATLTDELNKTVEPLKARAISIFAQLDSVMGDIRHIVNKENRDNLSKSVASLKSTLANLESATGGLDTLVTEEKDKLAKIFDNLESITGNIKNNNDKIQNILTNFSALSDTLAKSNFKSAIESADKALTEAADVFKKINSGEGSIGMLVNNDSLYNNLNNASKNLDNLFIDIKEHPGRYVTISVFGSKEKKANK